MEMEMEMRGGEDIRMGQDITPPLSPLSFSLHHSFLHSHCSSCFSPLPPTPFHPTTPPSSSSSSPSLLYCSSLCSSSDSPLHFYSAEFHLFRHYNHAPPPSDLRAALRLLHSLSSHPHRHGRISGLLTNRDQLIAADDDELLVHVRDGARAICSARRLRDGNDDVLIPEENENDVVEAALCLILTNAVEVQDSEGRALGIAVYDTTFSWINHSCSPNACYRFLISPPGGTPVDNTRPPRIVPSAGINGEKNVYTNFEFRKGYAAEYGPRLIVRSIQRIGKNEEVTVAYTDLLQPKAIRQSELWSKYRFVCCCSRCSASPPSYVDHILQEITSSNLASSSLSSDHSFCRDEAMRKLTDSVDEVITEYLSTDDAESCCDKLENLLTIGLVDETLENKERKPQLSVRLHPLNHLALNAYMTLASAYRVQASDLLAVNSDSDNNQLKSFNMMRKAAAYSFLLAAATYHLLCFEPSLIVSVANFCTNAGQSLLSLARSSVWNLFGKRELPDSQLFSVGENKCSKCSLLDRFESNLYVRQGQYEDIDSISSEFLDCIRSFSTEVWSSLSQGCHCHHLKMFSNPTDFVSLGASQLEVSLVRDHMDSDCWIEQKFTNHARMNIFQLGVHCLLYGKLLVGICYNKH